MIIEKVVGVTFREQPPMDEFKGDMTEAGNVPCVKNVRALIVPELDNQHDPKAKLVVAELKNGQTHAVGYLSKTGDLYQSLMDETKPIIGTMTVLGYSHVGHYGNSYQITVSL